MSRDFSMSSSDITEWRGEDIVIFQEALLHQVKGQISSKWFYTHIKSTGKSLPRIDVLNMLSQFMEYENWADFKAQFKTIEEPKSEKKKIKYFQPISSNIFGLTSKKKQNEDTLYNPNSIYALAKTTAIYACKMYNRIYNVHACGAIFYNHESPRRTSEYVSKKIIEQSVQIYLKKRKYLYLGDITANIDWGYAKEYVEAAWKIMQNKKPDFFIIASGKKNSVKDFVSICFNQLGLNYNKHIKIDKKLLRPSKTSSLVGDISKAKKQIKFNPKVDLKKLINIMIKNELKKY